MPKFNRKYNPQKPNIKSESRIVNIPCEIFTDICRYIPPIDLVTLSKVCKKFRRWLVAPSNFGTEQIWKTSRSIFLPTLRSPPCGISEQCYVFLNLIELGCQFCGIGRIVSQGELPTEAPVKVYWMFRVRCCKNCFLERVITANQIKEEKYVLDVALSGVPYLVHINRPHVYWKKDVDAAIQEYSRIDKKDLVSWQNEKIRKLEQHNMITAFCNDTHHLKLLDKLRRKQRLKSIIRSLSTFVPNDANRTLLEVEIELRRCPTHKKYASSEVIKLFTEDHWNRFQEIIYSEYNAKREYAALRARQYELFLKVYSLIPSKYSMNDPIVQYLCHCPSFKKLPSHQDVITPWDDNFLDKEFIPLLAQEAINIARNNLRIPPITTVGGMKKLRLMNRCVFLCKLCIGINCNEGYEKKKTCLGLFDYKNLLVHLKSRHAVQKIVDKEMVAVDFLEAVKI
ncbi:7534_t:CDS:2 [Acaulospora morrowiae]|uniref:7534_t:CDS:1 n=1 Tax=Acaulospora morrowiae TaxID=94023 RepID=A0A9N8WJJ2_9GLOM|nr:7534_t:CDS:2 [Acaulospora morrowiae]